MNRTITRSFAVTLGLLAFSLAVFRGMAHGFHPSSTILMAIASMWAFCLIGAILGAFADTLVQASVREQMVDRLANDRRSEKAPNVG